MLKMGKRCDRISIYT